VLGARLVALGLALALAAATLAACGDATPPEPTVLRVLMTDDWVTPPFIDAIREFERDHPDVRVNVSRGNISRMADAVRAGISSGEPPDVVQSHAFSAAGLGLAEPLDDLWAAHLRPEEFLPGAVEDVTWAGRRYGVPLDTNAMVVLYNADHFRDAGLAPPGPDTTFAEFEALARALTTPDGSRRGLAVSLSNWTSYGWVRANGGELVRVGDNGDVRLTLDAPPVVDALGFLARLVSDGWAFGPEPVDSRSADAYALFQAGLASMHTSGSWDLVRVRKEAPGTDWGVAMMPHALDGTGTVMGGSSLWVPRGSPNRELAFEFMLHVISDRYALRFAKEEGRLPVRPRLFSDPHFADPDLRVFLEQLPSARPLTLGAFDGASKAFEAALGDVLGNHQDAATALGEAQTRAVASLGPP
jgi:ABC-type glycerol-3-phosphate transport system substrate-binding protein